MVNEKSDILGDIQIQNLDEKHRNLFGEIKTFYQICKDRESSVGPIFSKPYVVFSYNLFEMNLSKKALLMLENISEDYFGRPFLADMRIAESNWQEAELLKNKVKKQEKEHHIKCRQEAEFFIVAWGLITRLSKEDHFPHRQSFLGFIELLKTQTFKIKMVPNIGLVRS